MEEHGANVSRPSERRPYRRPCLVDYGSVAKLTQGSGPTNGDGGQGMMP